MPQNVSKFTAIESLGWEGMAEAYKTGRREAGGLAPLARPRWRDTSPGPQLNRPSKEQPRNAKDRDKESRWRCLVHGSKVVESSATDGRLAAAAADPHHSPSCTEQPSERVQALDDAMSWSSIAWLQSWPRPCPDPAPPAWRPSWPPRPPCCRRARRQWTPWLRSERC